MKKKFLGALIALVMAGSVFAQETNITERELPVAVKQSSAKYFGKTKINMIIKDVDRTKTTYDIYFADQTKAEFHSNGALKDAENKNGLPKSVVPTKIANYVGQNYPNVKITQWERSRNKQDVKLSNGVELEFDLNGKFLRQD